ncbi:MAG: putative bifunctional diguanylate cyclase/phosphodiesterase [Pontibacterium sp.]
MHRYSHLSVAKKIRLMIMLTTAGALLLASAVFVSVEVQISRSALVERVQVLTEIVSTHVTAALSFDDVQTAESLLKSMTSEPDILEAHIYDRDGHHFASYRAANLSESYKGHEIHEQFLKGQAQHYFTRHKLYLASPIKLGNEIIGQLHIQVSLNTLLKQIGVYILGVLAILVGVLLLVYLLTFYLHRRISGPIEQLLEGMKVVAEEQDYSLRIKGGDNDEIGAIIQGFNGMIGHIEKRNKEIKQKNQEVEQHAFFDALTELPNRRLLMLQLEKEVERSKRNESTGALMYLDLDHFKIINDSLGHSTGDDLLVNVSQRLKKLLRSVDMPARVGGDEFVIILPELDQTVAVAANNALLVAESIRSSISQPYEIDGRTLHTSPSIGITLFNSDNCNTSDIIKQADLAMYQAKDDGRNLVQFFADDMQLLAVQRLQIEEDLRFALETDLEQLEIYFQPQVDHAGGIQGAEVLLRWHHPQKGNISPATFVPVAETTGLIHPLGKWVLSEACKQLAVWQAQGIKLQLAVNVSPNEFLHADFVASTLAIINSSGIDPSWLELEITEGVLLRNIDEVVRVMVKLKRYGIQFAVDDFGTGYSSLQYLKTLPLSKLKIDQSFVRDITTDPNDAAIVITIIAMTKHLGLEVIAEGVETEEERNFLYNNGCDLFQGYFFSKPLTLNAFEAQLKTKHPMSPADVA